MGNGTVHTYAVITVRYLQDVGVMQLERVPRGENPLLPASELVKWQAAAGEPPVPVLADRVNASSVVRHDEVAHYAGQDTLRGITFFVCATVAA